MAGRNEGTDSRGLRRVLTLAAVATALVATGCGGNDDGGGPEATPERASPTVQADGDGAAHKQVTGRRKADDAQEGTAARGEQRNRPGARDGEEAEGELEGARQELVDTLESGAGVDDPEVERIRERIERLRQATLSDRVPGYDNPRPPKGGEAQGDGANGAGRQGRPDAGGPPAGPPGGSRGPGDEAS